MNTSHNRSFWGFLVRSCTSLRLTFLCAFFASAVIAPQTISAAVNPDVVLQNQTTGQVYAWSMNDTAITGGANVGYPPADWNVVASGDFNGDGNPDLVLQNQTTGQVYVWFMNGTTITGGASVGYPPADWNVVASADFNGDGNPDLVLQNQTTGQVYVWFMNGTTITGGANVGYPPADWNVVGTFTTPPSVPTTPTLTVTLTGTGSGTVTGSGINCPGVCSENLTSGTQVTLTATPDSSSTFTSWSGCGSTDYDLCMVTMNGNKPVTATFTAIGIPTSYTLTVGAGPGGHVLVPGTCVVLNAGQCVEATETSGTQVTLTATANSGYTFASWSGCDSTSGDTCTVTMNKNRTVSATFTAVSPSSYTLTVSITGTGGGTVTGSGIKCGEGSSACTENLPAGTQVTLTATPGVGAVLQNFGPFDSCTSLETCTLLMNQNRTVDVTFATTCTTTQSPGWTYADPGTGGCIYYTGALVSGRVMSTPDGRCSLILQPNGLLELIDYNINSSVWTSGPTCANAWYLAMQPDGDLEVWCTIGTTPPVPLLIWFSGTEQTGADLAITDANGSCQIYILYYDESVWTAP
jgi:hypothetical protein